VGLLWFVARGEWRRLAIALGATLVTVVASAMLMPGVWHDWVALLMASAQQPPADTWLAVPIWMRLPAAGALVWWGARTDRAWTVAAAVTLALPVIWFAGLAILVAALRSQDMVAAERRAPVLPLPAGQQAAARAA
jgi:hypothetical protein